MTKSEAKVLETDVIIFPMKFGQTNEETVLTDESENKIAIKEQPTENDIDNRFARLRKSSRKRSISIL